MQELIRKICRWLRPRLDEGTREALCRKNLQNTKLVSNVATVTEGLILIYLTTKLGTEEFSSKQFITVVIGLIVNLLTAVWSGVSCRDKGKITGKHLRIKNLFVYAYTVVLILWSTQVSFMHYSRHEQINTFYIITVMYTMYIIAPPIQSLLYIAGGFGVMYALMFCFDGARSVVLVNFLFMAMLCWIGCANLYHIKVREIRLTRHLEKESVTDELTGLFNRGGLRHAFPELLGEKLSVMITDVDKFKYFNDTYGHMAGDRILGEISQILLECFPKNTIYRYGGDEFMIIMPGGDEAAFLKCKDKWDEKTRSITIENVPVAVSCSSGHAFGLAKDGEALRGLIREADKALYDVKKVKGTNRE